jgi:hypothetical protein
MEDKSIKGIDSGAPGVGDIPVAPFNGAYTDNQLLRAICTLLSGGGGSGLPITIADGADVAEGSTGDPAVTNPTSSATVIAALKGLLSVLQSGTQLTEIGNFNDPTWVRWEIGTDVLTNSGRGLVETIGNTTPSDAFSPASASNKSVLTWSLMGGYDGTNFRRLRVSTPTDTFANPTAALGVQSFSMGWNGSTWDRFRMVTPSDAFANPTMALLVQAMGMLWDGTNWRRMASTVLGNLKVGIEEYLGATGSAANFNMVGTATGVAFSVLAASTSRRGVVICNNSNKTVLLCMGQTASATQFTYSLSPNGVLEVPFHFVGISISGIWTGGPAATGQLTITIAS